MTRLAISFVEQSDLIRRVSVSPIAPVARLDRPMKSPATHTESTPTTAPCMTCTSAPTFRPSSYRASSTVKTRGAYNYGERHDLVPPVLAGQSMNLQCCHPVDAHSVVQMGSTPDPPSMRRFVWVHTLNQVSVIYTCPQSSHA